MLLRHVVSLMSLFLQVRNNDSFYISNIQTMTWTKLSSVPDIQPRAYHTATTCVLSGTLSVFLIGGGVTYSGNFPTDTIAVNECVILKVLDITSLDKIIFKMEKKHFLVPATAAPPLSIVFLLLVASYIQEEKQMT